MMYTLDDFIAETGTAPRWSIPTEDDKWMQGPFRLLASVDTGARGESASLLSAAARASDGRLESAYGSADVLRAHLHLESIRPIVVGAAGGPYEVTAADMADLVQYLQVRTRIGTETRTYSVGDHLDSLFTRERVVLQAQAADADWQPVVGVSAGEPYFFPEGGITLDAEQDALELVYAGSGTPDHGSTVTFLVLVGGVIVPHGAPRASLPPELAAELGCGTRPGRIPLGQRGRYMARVAGQRLESWLARRG